MSGIERSTFFFKGPLCCRRLFGLPSFYYFFHKYFPYPVKDVIIVVFELFFTTTPVVFAHTHADRRTDGRMDVAGDWYATVVKVV